MTTIPLPSPHNNKLGCDFVIHLMQKARRIGAESFQKEVVLKVGDTEGIYRLHDYTDMPMKEVPLHLIYSSFGVITRPEFYRLMNEHYGVLPGGECGVYFFELRK